ncbi:MAG TPA: DNA polymerase III subunit beta [Desulfomicrobiaceae bacterium]|nr:DNA polymerase III subunit beta [Desulfomicrobiaceae bacterium]
MYFKALKEDIIDGLQKSSNIIPVKTGAAFLRTVWVQAEGDSVKIMATDSSIEFVGSYPAAVEQPGLVGVQGKKFSELIRKMPPGEISFTLSEKDGNLLIQQGRRRYKLPTNDASWFQEFTPFPEENVVIWSGDYFKEIIDRISFCISDDDAMQGMNCVRLSRIGEEKVEICGMNGHQFGLLQVVNQDVNAVLGEEGVLISKKYLSEIKKLLTNDEIGFNISDKRLFLRTGRGKESFSLPLKSYQFPDYKNFIAQYEDKFSSVLEVDKHALVDALDRIQIFNTDNNRSVFFEMKETELALCSQGQDIGEASEMITARYAGSLERIAMPTRVVMEILSHFQSDTVRFQFSGSFEPCRIEGDDDPSYMIITMPVEVTEDTYYTEEEVL